MSELDVVRGLVGEGPLAGEGSQYFEQWLDHFEQGGPDRRAFQQQYFVRASYYYARSAPVFVYVGGESPLFGPPKRHSFVDTLARDFGALLLALEHRYYGQSIKTTN